jgi:uroporphyrin-III C-methyltransferase
MPGKVYIVGAGPGDPELLTLKAIRVLASADVVLHDELVNFAVLQHVRTGAIIENVGKRSGGRHYPQNAIHTAMIFHASHGRCVVRLKGGDPSLFGRLGEELAALRQAGLEFEIVPGITAAVACAAEAKIPLTDRNAASSVMFISGHSCAVNAQPDWEAALRSGSTIALYMPGDCTAVAERLISAGMRADTPCAIVASASLPNEEIFQTELQRVADARIGGSPKLMIIGEVARLPEVASRAWEQGDSIFAGQAFLNDGFPSQIHYARSEGVAGA